MASVRAMETKDRGWIEIGSAAPALILGLALALRIVAAAAPDPTYYPDEVFQVLEQAHRLAFGYGFTPWEFEWGARNWALPGAVGGLLWTLDAVGLGRPEAYQAIVTGAAILASLTLVASVRRLASALAGEEAGLIAALVVAVSPPCVYAAQKITPEVWGGYALVGALALSLESSRRGAVLAGVLAGVAVGLRVHYAPALIAPFWMVLRGPGGWRGALAPTHAGAAAFAAFGALDWLTWGAPFASYVNLVWFNLGLGVADVFGRQGPGVYLLALGLSNSLAVLAALQWRTAWPPLACAALVVGVHLCIGHKEARFIFAAHPLIAAAFAIAAVRTAQEARLMLAGIVAASIAVMAWDSVSPADGQRHQDANGAFRVARLDPDFKALALAGVSVYDTPATYGLHLDAPVLDFPPSAVRPAIPEGVTHVLADRDFPALPDFVPVRDFPTAQLRKRIVISPDAPTPEATRRLPLRFDPRRGLVNLRLAPEQPAGPER
ncbi:glycosyltransferase family protein [Alsobacter sp. SYSU BS001988]